MEGRDVEGFGENEIDPTRFDNDAFTALPVPAGSVAFFGPLVVQRSGPNRSERDRRAFLYSYQPEGFPHSREYVRVRPPRGSRGA